MGEPSHWTYCPVAQSEHLQQGDIIRRSPALLRVLKEVLSYFCDERYTAFLVVTQSCDLVQRNAEPCKAEYVNLCVIRELEPYLPTLLEPCCGVGVPGIFDSERRLYADQLLKRIVNQNEQARGLFYLHPDADVEIATASVALLRVSIALRRDHYGMLQECRCGRLGPEYAAKLGWLTGNLYSRVATRDWEDQEQDKAASAKQAQSLLRRISLPNEENWVPARWLKAARGKNVDLNSIPVERFRSALSEYAPPDLLDVVLESVQRVGRGVVADEPCAAVSVRLAGHDPFAREVASRAAGFGDGILSTQERDTLRDRLASDDKFRRSIGDQVANLLKRRAVEIGTHAVNELPDLLARSTGVLVPASMRLQATLSHLLGPDRADEVDRIVGVVAGSCVFSHAATQIAVGETRDVFAQVHFAVLDKLISRLKNDQKLRAACREQGGDQPLSSLLLD